VGGNMYTRGWGGEVRWMLCLETAGSAGNCGLTHSSSRCRRHVEGRPASTLCINNCLLQGLEIHAPMQVAFDRFNAYGRACATTRTHDYNMGDYVTRRMVWCEHDAQRI